MARTTAFVSLLPLLTVLAGPAMGQALPASAPVPSGPEVGVPFGCGMSFPISQVHNVGSHLHNDVWAWDFRMPEGTPVVAALEGVVRLARGDSDAGGCDPRMAPMANYVVVQHAGGVETQYLHFSSVVVSSGDHVREGQLLGYSGQTGWACGAHLHFKVARPETDGWNNPSVPARIAGFGDPSLESWVASPACTGGSVVADATQPTRPSAAVAPVALTTDDRLTASEGLPTLGLGPGPGRLARDDETGLGSGASGIRPGLTGISHPLAGGAVHLDLPARPVLPPAGTGAPAATLTAAPRGIPGGPGNVVAAPGSASEPELAPRPAGAVGPTPDP